MDAFYASVEQRNNPSLKGKPVVVGGRPDSRGVVSTCSYEARKYGIHSAMPAARAYKLCPHAVFISHHNFSEYKKVSGQIREIFFSYTDLVEPLSLDEAYLDVTENKPGIPSATIIAGQIRQQIKEVTELTASAGVSYNKFIAKIASDMNKPDGITVITPDTAEAFLEELPIGKFFGIGKRTEERMKNIGILKGGDLKKRELYELLELFGKSGSYYYYAVRGIDNRPVEPKRTRKSLGRENTFSKDIQNMKEIYGQLRKIAEKVEEDCRKTGLSGRQLTLKVKYHDFKVCTRCTGSKKALSRADQIMKIVPSLLEKTSAGDIPVRLLGLSLGKLNGNLYSPPEPQMELDLFASEG